MRSGKHIVLSWLCVVILITAGLPLVRPVGTARAAGPRVFFSEYVEGSGDNQALEIFNGTGATIDLAGGYNIQIYFDGSPNPGRTIDLAGTVAHGDVYVIARASAAAAILARADQTASGAWFDGNDAVVLRKGNVRLDVFGQIGANPGSGWSEGGSSTANSTLRRNHCEGDPNGSNYFGPVGWWQVLPMDTFDGLGTHTADCPSLPVSRTLLWVILAVMTVGLAVGVEWITRRKDIKLGILGTFLKWLAVYTLLMPVAEFIAARGDERTMALGATAELAAIALVAGVIIGWTQRDRTVGALEWIGVIILSFVPVALSFSDAGTGLDDIAGFSPFGAIALSLVLYEAAFFITHYLRQRRT